AHRRNVLLQEPLLAAAAASPIGAPPSCGCCNLREGRRGRECRKDRLHRIPIEGPRHDPFLNELTSMYERNRDKGSVWVTLKRSSLKCKAKKNKMQTAGETIEYRCLVRATDGKRTISTSLSAKDHQRFQASYSTILKAHMDSLKKRERKDKKRTAEVEKKVDDSKKASRTKS
ncbi:hypothetical protein Taro_016166, partial [Colocasia esculenta]|nr:hypothetical protein [Colocasia esculenta]